MFHVYGAKILGSYCEDKAEIIVSSSGEDLQLCAQPLLRVEPARPPLRLPRGPGRGARRSRPQGHSHLDGRYSRILILRSGPQKK